MQTNSNKQNKPRVIVYSSTAVIVRFTRPQDSKNRNQYTASDCGGPYHLQQVNNRQNAKSTHAADSIQRRRSSTTACRTTLPNNLKGCVRTHRRCHTRSEISRACHARSARRDAMRRTRPPAPLRPQSMRQQSESRSRRRKRRTRCATAAGCVRGSRPA